MSLLTLFDGDVFNPRRLFIGSTGGFIYSYDDFAYLYQKSDGSTPVTALEQPVGLVRDQRYGNEVGADVRSASAVALLGVATAATFDTTTGAGSVTRVDASNQSSVRFTLTANTFYRITITNSGAATINLRSGTEAATTWATVAAGATSTLLVLASSAGVISITAASAATIAFTVSALVSLPGLHAYQATDAARPVISARVNLLLNTVFAGAAAGTPGTAPTSWTLANSGGSFAVSGSSLTFAATGARQTINQTQASVTVAAHTLRVKVEANPNSLAVNQILTKTGTSTSTNQYQINGSNVATSATPVAGDILTLIATVTVAGSLTFNIGAGASDATTGAQSITLSEPDLRLTADANSRIPAYQRVTTATDYDAVGFPRFLRVDATDDFLQTASVDPGTDKVFVCAGVTKMSDAAAGILLESSTTSANPGCFALFAPGGASATFSFRSTGTIVADAATAGNASPKTAVLSGIGNISGDSALLRINGVDGTLVTADQGAGNYTAQPLYIGARAGTSLRLNNGRIYPMVICFKAVTAGEIAATEQWVNARTRAY